MDDLPARRRFYAEEVCAVAGVDDPALLEAFARVPRERFLGPGPWSIVAMEVLPGGPAYRTTPDADPAHLYHDVLVAIDPARQLNNGHPSALARWLTTLRIRPGDRVVHLGCGVGYYTAILAELAGPEGSVAGIEVDPGLAERARANLADRRTVRVVTGDGADVPPCDAMFVNAGCTRPRPAWLDALAPGGRLLVPLTARQTPHHSSGLLVRIGRDGERLTAEWVSRIGIYDCVGARDPADEEAIRAFLRVCQAAGALRPVRSLLRAAHEPGPDCVLHTPTYCLSAG